MEKLKENYIDDILDTSKNQRRKYKQVNNDDGTISLIDVTDYEQVGSEFLASDMNAITKAVNGKVDSDGDSSNTTVAFTEPTELSQPTTGEKLSGIIGKVSLAIKNLKTLITLMGTTDISSIGNGTVTGAINDVNSKLSNLGTVKYDEDSDKVQLLFGGVWTDWMDANLKSFYIFKNGVYQNKCSTGNTFNSVVSISTNLVMNGQPSGVFSGFNIFVPNIKDKIVAGKKLHMVCKLDKVDSSTLVTITGAANSSNYLNPYVEKKISTTMTEYIYDLSSCPFSESASYLYIGMYSYVGCPKYNFYIESMWLG